MATKASGTLVLIIEKQHASWDLMVTASCASWYPGILPVRDTTYQDGSRESPQEKGIRL